MKLKFLVLTIALISFWGYKGQSQTVTITGGGIVCAPPSATFTADTLIGSPSGGVWVSDNPACASIDPVTGIVHGLEGGIIPITYTVGGNSAIFILTVGLPSDGGVGGLPLTTCVGAPLSLSALAPGGLWSSSDTDVAHIDGMGHVMPLSTGTAVISYTMPIGCAVIQAVTVHALPAVGSIGGASTLCAGASITLTDTTVCGTWSNDNPAMATISSTGLINGLASGTTIVSYTLSNDCGDSSATLIVTVNDIPLAPAPITGDTVLCAAASVTLSDTSSGYSWSSDMPSVATVDGTGLLTGVTAGTATVSYTMTNGCGSVSATLQVTVNPLPDTPASITGIDSLCSGESLPFTDGTTGGVWSSSNPAIAAINSGGMLTAVSSGLAVISYSLSNTCGTASTTFPVFVKLPSDCLPESVGVTNGEAKGVRIFPNPSNGSFSVSFDGEPTASAHLLITNMLGERVSEFTLSPGKALPVNISRQAGIYLLHVVTAHHYDTQRIIVR